MSEEMEAPQVWSPVIGFEGIYEVSDQGNFRSLDRVLDDGRKRAGKPITISYEGKNGSACVQLSRGGKQCTFSAAGLVLGSFGIPHVPGTVAVQKNGFRGDLRLENLKWGVRRGNHTPRGASNSSYWDMYA